MVKLGISSSPVIKEYLLRPAHGRIILLTLLFIGGPALPSAEAQFRRILNFASDILADTSSPEKARFIAYPTIAYTPETSWEFGISALLVYHARKDTSNRLSEVSTFSFLTLEGQYGLWMDHALYSHRNDWFFLGRLRYQRFPLKYYGIGPNTPREYAAVVDGNFLLLRERILRRIYRSLYAGLEVDYQQLSRTQFRWAENQSEPVLPRGGQGSSNLGLGVGLVYDQRHNVLNVREGFFGELAWLGYRQRWGSAFDFEAAFIDMRYFLPTVRSEVLAFQFYSVLTRGDVPFNQLALMGGETIMRGYYTGRYRDQNLTAAQVEYRWLPFAFSRRWGAALFLGAGLVDPDLLPARTDHIRLAGGGGLRFLLFPRKDIYTRIDLAFTREGTGAYFYIGEAF